MFWLMYKIIMVPFKAFYYFLVTLPKMILEKAINTFFDSYKESKKGERAAKHLAKAKIKEANMGSSGADELRKYKELMDDGIISEEEFQRKKKQIMS